MKSATMRGVEVECYCPRCSRFTLSVQKEVCDWHCRTCGSRVELAVKVIPRNCRQESRGGQVVYIANTDRVVAEK